jgi:hypothetical protein
VVYQYKNNDQITDICQLEVNMKYKIMEALKIKTDIASIAASLIGKAVILVSSDNIGRDL